jgi:hypothetical protein
MCDKLYILIGSQRRASMNLVGSRVGCICFINEVSNLVLIVAHISVDQVSVVYTVRMAISLTYL